MAKTPNAAPKTIEEVMRQADKITDESVKSTRRILQIASETDDTGAKTLEMLDSQEEQLKRINQDFYEVDNDLRKSEKHLREMEKCCGCFTLFWRRHRNYERSSTYKKGFKPKKDKKQDKKQDKKKGKKGKKDEPTDTAATASGQLIYGKAPAPEGGFIERITNDAREDEMEENLQQTNQILHHLRMQAVVIGEKLDEQNEMLDGMNDRAAANRERLQKVGKRTNTLLK